MKKKNRAPFQVAVRILGILTAMLVFAAGCGGGGQGNAGTGEESPVREKTDIVLYLDGVAVTAEEYALLAGENASRISMRYTTEQANNADFWETPIDGNYPYQMLADLVQEELERCYAIRGLAVDMGLTEDYDYDSLLAAGRRENEKGEGSSEEEISYGLTAYDDSSFYHHWYSDLETQVINALIRDQISVTEADCRDYYEENRDDFICQTRVRVLYAEISPGDAGGYEQAVSRGEQMLRAMEVVASKEELTDAFPEVSLQEMELSSLDTKEEKSGMYSQRWEIASGLQKGEAYGPYEEGGMICLVRCLEREENSLEDFENVSSRIQRYLQVQKAENIIEERARRTKTEEGNVSVREVILRAVGADGIGD